ncbi:16741_t:CDS:2, partial [Gigaspora margarita]
YVINLIAANLVKLDQLKKLITDCGKINHFFNTSHSSHSLLTKGFTDMKIKGGGLKTWIKTRWRSLYFTTNSILSITNQEIANLMANKDFFIMCQLVRSVWQPIKEVIYALETNEAILADCFAYLIKLAGLKDSRFHRAALLSLELWQNLWHTQSEGEELIAQMRRFDARLSLFDLPYISDIDTPKIW